MLVDTHAHLDFTEDKKGWIARAKEAGVDKIICVGTSVAASKKCVEIAQNYSSDELSIYATVGIHAQDGKEDVEKYGSLSGCIDELRKIARSSNKVIGVGETGFDFKSDELSDKVKKFQNKLFEVQIELAMKLKLPLIIHCRHAFDETFDLLSTMNREPITGLFHSWTGDSEAAQKALDLGFYISFSGIVTFKNAPAVQDVAKRVPLDRMILETDSPFLAPDPLRGMLNEPKNVKIVGKFIADLRGQPFELISSQTTSNAIRLFGL